MTYSEGNQYQPINVWDIYTRESPARPWEKLRTSTQDETSIIEKNNRDAGWQAYAISRRTVAV